jgi:hypothetical protein
MLRKSSKERFEQLLKLLMKKKEHFQVQMVGKTCVNGGYAVRIVMLCMVRTKEKNMNAVKNIVIFVKSQWD